LSTFDVSATVELSSQFISPVLAVNATADSIGRPQAGGAGLALQVVPARDEATLWHNGAVLVRETFGDGAFPDGRNYTIRLAYDGQILRGWFYSGDAPDASLISAPAALVELGDRVGLGATMVGGVASVCFDDLVFACPVDACNRSDDDCDGVIDEVSEDSCLLDEDNDALARPLTAVRVLI
jgi:hypothetical protein